MSPFVLLLLLLLLHNWSSSVLLLLPSITCCGVPLPPSQLLSARSLLLCKNRLLLLQTQTKHIFQPLGLLAQSKHQFQLLGFKSVGTATKGGLSQH
jgi:hypothetical protein